MNFRKYLDKLISIFIIFFAYSLINYISLYCLNNFEYNYLFKFYFPYGIVVLSFLFFGNKIIYGLLLSLLIFNIILPNYDFKLTFENYFIISLFQFISVPLTIIILNKLNFKIGIGPSYKIDKTNINHVLLFTFFSTIMIGLFILIYFFVFDKYIDIFYTTLKSFFGAAILILFMKLVVYLTEYVKRSLNNN